MIAPRQLAVFARRSSLGSIQSFPIEENINAKPVSARRRSIQLPIEASDKCARDTRSTDCMELTEEEYSAVPYNDSYLEEAEQPDYEGVSSSKATSDVASFIATNNELNEEVAKKSLACPSGMTLGSIEEEEQVYESEKFLLERIDQIESDDETVIYEKEQIIKHSDKSSSDEQGLKDDTHRDSMKSIVTKPAKTLKQTKWNKLKQSLGKFVSKGSECDAKESKVTETITESDLFKPKTIENNQSAISSKRGRTKSIGDFRKSPHDPISQADLAHLQCLNDMTINTKSGSKHTKSAQVAECYSKNTLRDLPWYSGSKNRRVSLDISALKKASRGVSKEELLGIESRHEKGKERNLFAMLEEQDTDSDDKSMHDTKVTKVTKTINMIPSPPTESDLFKPRAIDDNQPKRGRSQSVGDFRKSSHDEISQADLTYLQCLNDKTKDSCTKSAMVRESYSKNTLRSLPWYSASRNRHVSLDISALKKASRAVSKEELLGLRSRPEKDEENLYAMFEEQETDSDKEYELDDREYDFNKILEDPGLFKLYVKH